MITYWLNLYIYIGIYISHVWVLDLDSLIDYTDWNNILIHIDVATHVIKCTLPLILMDISFSYSHLWLINIDRDFKIIKFHYPLVNVYSLQTGKSPFLIGKSAINGPFSIAMLNDQRVNPTKSNVVKTKSFFPPHLWWFESQP
jgi:hypothetical protein